MDKINPSIGCTVTQCMYHSRGQDYCSLDKIMVVTHETDPKVDQCTDCQSFRRK